METHETESIGNELVIDGTMVPDFAAQIEDLIRNCKIREKIRDIPENGVLRAADDFFGTREDTDKNVIDVEYEVM